MSAHTQHLFQWVWGTKYNEPTLSGNGQNTLYAYIAGILKNKKCFVHSINGVEDHLHIVSSLHPVLNVSGLIKDIKLSTSDFIKREDLFPDFRGWQEGYGSFTYSKSSLNNLVKYVENQKSHHRHKTYLEELIDLLTEHGIDYDERYLL
jgi:putative transposase